jgi:AbiV family abortive infection protein
VPKKRPSPVNERIAAVLVVLGAIVLVGVLYPIINPRQFRAETAGDGAQFAFQTVGIAVALVILAAAWQISRKAQRRKHQEYPVTIDQLKEGISLSRKNARRLAHDAAVLLAQGGSRASVYAQWHLAVEELGKSSILEACASSEVSPGKVQIPASIFGGAHQSKFSAGLAFLPQTQQSGLGLSVTVTANSSAVDTTFQDPYGGKGRVTVGAGVTGRMTTQGDGIGPSHDLRLRLLYVDFDGTKWREPEAELISETMAKISVSPEDLKRAIDELLAVLSTV